MFPDTFEYYRPESVKEALELLSEHPGAELLAGGHSLLPTMKSGLASPEVLIDVSTIEDPGLSGVEVGEETTTVGALTTYAELVESGARDTCPTVVEAAGEIGDVQVRNRGTVGGNLAHSDPASDLPGAMLAADATIYVQGADGEREISAEDFFLAMYATALGEDELLTRVEVPNLGPNDAGAYAKKPSPSSGYAIVGVAVRLQTNGETIQSARVGANGAVGYARRLEPVEGELEGAAIDADGLAEAAGGRATEDLETWELMDDLQTSGEFRGRLLEAYTERAVERALGRVVSE